jgi:hypothetical protein
VNNTIYHALVRVVDEIKLDNMKKTILEYTKMILSKVSFDKQLLKKEYKKAIKSLNISDKIELNSWMKSQELQPAYIH